MKDEHLPANFFYMLLNVYLLKAIKLDNQFRLMLVATSTLMYPSLKSFKHFNDNIVINVFVFVSVSNNHCLIYEPQWVQLYQY